MSRFLFFLAEAFRALRRSAAPSMAAIVTIAVTTLLLGVLVPVLKASGDTNESVRDQVGLRVFLYDDATKAETANLERKLLAIPHVDGVEFISKSEAVEVLSDDLKGDLRESLSELNTNPLPASFDVDLDEPENLAAVRSAIIRPGASGEPKPISPIVQPEIADARDDAKTITQVTGTVKKVLIVLAALLLVASLLLVANTIRLSIYARRREVEVMQLVGATNWFIRWPFMIEGVIVGLAGALIAVGILFVGKVIVDPLSENFALVDNFSTMGFLPLVIILVAAATLVSAVGSGITLRRFLRV